MSTTPVTPELDSVDHPILGPLKFPKDMPFEERNASIENLEHKHNPSAGGSYEPDGFLSSLGHSISNTLHNNAQGYLHAGPGQASEVQPTFNPFHPIETAGYLVPQPIKDIPAEWGGNKPAAIGHAVGEAAPYALGIPSPEGAAGMAGDAGSALVRGGAKTANAAIHNAPAIGAATGGIGGLVKGLEHGPAAGAYGSIIGGALGERVGNLIHKIPDVPGERFGLPEPTGGMVRSADRPGTHLRIGQPDEVPGGIIHGDSTLSRAAYLSRNPPQVTPEAPIGMPEPESVKQGNPTPFARSAAAGAEDFGRQGSTSEQLAASKPGMSKGRMAEQIRGGNSPFGSRFKSTVEAPEEEDLSPWGGTFKKKEGR